MGNQNISRHGRFQVAVVRPFLILAAGAITFCVNAAETTGGAPELAAFPGAVMTPVVRTIAPPPEPVIDVRNHGAKGDGVTDDTVALQKAIDACTGSGGSILLKDGKFLSGHLQLKGGMTLYVAKGATLLGSAKPEDYPVTLPPNASGTAAWGSCQRSLLYACNADGLRIDGGGEIDGQGALLLKAGMQGKEPNRPSLLRVFSSKDVAVRNVTLRNSLMWTQVYDQCEKLVIENLEVYCPPIYRNHDGMDVCNCRDVVIRNNLLEADDDVICLKSHGPAGMRNVLIENNTIYCYRANGIKFGTSTLGDIRDIRILNNTVLHAKYGGLCVESVDGAHVSGVTVRGLDLIGCAQPIFIRLGYRGGYWEIDPKVYPPAVGSLTGVVIENIRVLSTHTETVPACTITGITGKKLGEVTLKNIYVEMPGGVTGPVRSPAENDKVYPQSNMFGKIPAYAFFVRHADKVRFENVRVGWFKPDTRPWLVSEHAQVETVGCEDLKQVKPALSVLPTPVIPDPGPAKHGK